MVFRNLAVLACMFTCAASAFARAEFASLAQAQTAFATEDPADRERAYRYVLDAVGAADGRNAFARLQILRTMAGALGRVSEYDAVCERGLSSPDEAVRFASLMALALSPSAARAPEDFVSRLEGAARGGVALDVAHRIETLKTAADFRATRLRDGRGAEALLDEAVGLGGCPRTFAAVARRAKDGSWYAAAINSSEARHYELDTSFLGDGKWTMESFCDAADADTVPTHYVHERSKVVKAGEKISWRMARGGGFAVKFSK